MPAHPLRRLIKRSQFKLAAQGKRARHPAFTLQSVKALHALPGIGFTVTKKVGNSPERNRIKRRLRAATAACAHGFVHHHDYVLIGHREALNVPFSKLVADLEALIICAHASRSTCGQRKPR